MLLGLIWRETNISLDPSPNGLFDSNTNTPNRGVSILNTSINRCMYFWNDIEKQIWGDCSSCRMETWCGEERKHKRSWWAESASIPVTCFSLKRIFSKMLWEHCPHSSEVASKSMGGLKHRSLWEHGYFPRILRGLKVARLLALQFWGPQLLPRL